MASRAWWGSINQEQLTPHLRPAVLVDNPNSIDNLGIKTPSLDNARAPSQTNIKTLLLLAKFTDQAETYPAANFQSSMFSTSSSSVRKYYREISYNHADVLPATETCGTADDGTTPWTLLPYIHPHSPGSDGQPPGCCQGRADSQRWLY